MPILADTDSNAGSSFLMLSIQNCKCESYHEHFPNNSHKFTSVRSWSIKF